MTNRVMHRPAVNRHTSRDGRQHQNDFPARPELLSGNTKSSRKKGTTKKKIAYILQAMAAAPAAPHQKIWLSPKGLRGSSRMCRRRKINNDRIKNAMYTSIIARTDSCAKRRIEAR